MKIPSKMSRLALATLAALITAGCAAADAPAPAPKAPAASASPAATAATAAPAAAKTPASAGLLDKVTAVIGDAGCDHPTECRVVGIGARPCGGPSGYRAWSTKTTDQPTLLAAVQAHAAAEKAEHEAAGIASDCRFMPPPTATCRPRVSDGKKTCQLGQGGVGRLD